jgi:hypothetical protein
LEREQANAKTEHRLTEETNSARAESEAKMVEERVKHKESLLQHASKHQRRNANAEARTVGKRSNQVEGRRQSLTSTKKEERAHFHRVIKKENSGLKKGIRHYRGVELANYR